MHTGIPNGILMAVSVPAASVPTLENWASIATIISALTATASIIFLARQVKLQRGATEVEFINAYSCRIETVYKEIDKYEHGLKSYINLLEEICYIINKKMVSKRAYECLADIVFDYVEDFSDDDITSKKIREWITHQTVYSEIRTFVEGNRDRLGQKYHRILDVFTHRDK